MRKSALIGLFALFASVTSALAGEVYVPYTSNKSIEGLTYKTKVWVTNTGTAARRFTVRYINQGVDGTKGDPTVLNIAGGGTLLLANLASQGTLGMLEVSGAPQLLVNARLEVSSPTGEILSSSTVTPVSGGNVIKAGATAHLQGLERTGRGTISDFGLVNVSNAAAQCTIKAYRANGTQISQTSVISLPPLSVRHFENVLAVLGESAISDARIETTCDKQFFPYAAVYEPGAPETNFVAASHSLDTDLISGIGNTPGTVVFQVPGTYLDAKPGASFKQFDIPIVEGVRYKKATVEFDLYVNKFPNGIFAGVTALRRTDRTLFYGLIVRGGRQKTILDMGVEDDVVTGSNGGPWRERNNYRVVLDYDLEKSLLTFRCFRNGALAETVTGRINHFDLAKNGKIMRVDFGQSGVADGAYFPPIGWKFSNLKVTFEPIDQ